MGEISLVRHIHVQENTWNRVNVSNGSREDSAEPFKQD